MLARLLPASALLVLLAASLAGAQASVQPEVAATTLFFHAADWQDFPINTQEPDPGSVYNGAQPLTPTLTCASPVLGNTGGVAQGYHTYRGYSSPVVVDYDGGTPQISPGRGIAHDILIDANVTPVLHWYFATSLQPDNSVAPQPTPIPNVYVTAVLRSGDAISVDDAAYDAGDIHLEGAAGPVTLAGGQVVSAGPSQGTVTGEQVGDLYVYHFELPMTVELALLQGSRGFNVRIDAYVDNPACGDAAGGTIAPSALTPFGDAEHRPRLELRNSPALSVEAPLAAVRSVDGIGFAWSVASVWGGYDVASRDDTLVVEGPADSVMLYRMTPVPVEGARPSDATVLSWEWDFGDEAPADGVYTVQARVANLQDTAYATSSLEVRLKDGQIVAAGGAGNELPGPALPLLAVAVLGAAFLLRRRA